jgi:hypothetical protein
MTSNKIKRGYIATALLATLLITLTSCAEKNSNLSPTYHRYVLPPDSGKSMHNLLLLNTYSYQQTTNYTCGPAVIMSLMHHYGLLSKAQMNRSTELRIANEMGTTMTGTSLENMAAWLEKRGFDVNYGQGVSLDFIRNNLQRGIPTILVWNDLVAHAMLVIGYYEKNATPDSEKDVIFFADPSTSSYLVSHEKASYGINSLSPGQLEMNWFEAQYFFNPSHSAVGMYLTALPKKAVRLPSSAGKH